MSQFSPHEEEAEVEAFIGNLLRVGVVVAAVVVACGALLFLLRHGGRIADYRVFHSEPEELRSVAGTVRGTFAGHSTALIQLGLVLLLATPVARVAFSLVVFARERDWLYVGTTAVVLGLLIFSLLAGRAA